MPESLGEPHTPSRLSRMLSPKGADAHALTGIQYVRAAAALVVILDHASEKMAQPKYFGRAPLGGVFEAGSVGVDVFFCLSGFIIVYIALDRAGAAKMSAWTFVKRRFARIVPFMWLVVIAYAALRLGARGAFPVWNYVRALSLFPIGEVDPSVVWTLRHEWLFYLVFGLSFLSGRRWLFGLWLLAPFVAVGLGLRPSPSLDGWPALVAFFCNPLDLLFGLGLALGLAFTRQGANWAPRWWAPPLLAVMLAVVFLTARALHYDRGFIWQVLIIGALSCAALAIALRVGPPRGWMADIGRRLGDASYCIYLTHTAIVSGLLGLLSKFAPGAPGALVLGVTFVACVAGGVVLHYLVERPLVEAAQRLVLRRSRPSQTDAPPISSS
jgi:peptidoglycan/LPS O-acetylase OafA/YrhL